MAAITAALIKQVREDTGAGMMDVKKALTEAEGDVARAKEIIRAKGIQAAGKREGRKAQEGTIASKVIESAEGQTGYAVELNSETDFVAKTPKFVEFADTVLGYAVAADSIPAQVGKISFLNANDGTAEGVTYTKFDAFSVQFRPAESAGPLNTAQLYDAFVDKLAGAR